jgi:hypothetical protein
MSTARSGAGRWCAGRLAARAAVERPGDPGPSEAGARSIRGKHADLPRRATTRSLFQGGESADGKAWASVRSVGAHQRPVLPGLSTVRAGVLTFMSSGPCILLWS